jgi:MATE family multidrug resistance protein
VGILKEWGQFILYAYSGFLMLSFKVYASELNTVLAGTLSTVQLSAQGVAFQIESIGYMFPIGLGVACSIRVAHYLGQANASGARTMARVGLLSGCKLIVFRLLVLKRSFCMVLQCSLWL